jgi:molybdopterin/thiamine biosynthesis adenylyltransferase
MSSKKVVVVGVGALGSHVVQFLRNVDADITVVDFDRVERKNVASQFHAKASVGKGKVAGLKQTMNFLFGKKINTVPHKLVEDNVVELLGDVDLVIDCLDNAASRGVVQYFCKAHGVPCLHGALDAAGSFGRVIWTDDFVIDEEGEEGQATCEDGEFLPFITLTAAFLARSAQLFLEQDRQLGFTVHPGGALST